MSNRFILLAATVLMLSLPVGAQTVFNPEWPRVGPFTAADTCSNCHDASDPGVSPATLRAPDPSAPDIPAPSGHNISPIFGQRIGVMGHTLNDPYFLAAVDDEVDHFPTHAGAIEDTCLRCHAPMGYDYAHGYANELLDANGDYRLDTALTQMSAREGVSCTLCHQIQIDPAAELINGTRIIGEDSILFGPIVDPVRTRMARYGVEFSAAIAESALCGSCHNLFTPVLDPVSGEPTGERFLEQAAWFEWRNSDYSAAVSCQDCHMATPGETYLTPVATYGDPPARANYSAHLSAGGNTQLLAILSDYRLQLGLDPRLTDGDFQIATEATEDLLAQAAILSVALNGEANTLQVDATIRNLTGHKLPTGYPARRMWLHLWVTDSAETLVFESGAADEHGRLAIDAVEAGAECVAHPKPVGFDNAACFTPHRDVIDDPSEVAVFESVMADALGDITYVLLSGRGYLKDNRLPPVGFTTDSEHFFADMASRGTEADGDFNALGSGQDTVHYRIPVSGANGPFTVNARLLYQSTRPAFVSVLGAETARVNDYLTYYQAVPPEPVQLAEVVAVAPIDRLFKNGFELEP